MATITSASAVFNLTVASVFPAPVRLQAWATDDAFTTDTVDAAETQVGVDGVGVGGWIPRAVMMRVRFLASSPSIAVFEQWIQAEDAITDILYGSASILIPATSTLYTCFQGVLRRISPVVNARRVLENREWTIEWLPQGIAPAITSAPLP